MVSVTHFLPREAAEESAGWRREFPDRRRDGEPDEPIPASLGLGQDDRDKHFV